MGALVVGGLMATSQGALADGGKKYKVTVTNPNRGQPLAPALFITHSKRFSLFETNGQPASPGLATMAETGAPFDLQAEVDGAPGVKSTDVLPGPNPSPPVFFPGVSDSFDITTSGSAKYFTVVAMLGATNDAFYALRGIKLPKKGKITLYAVAYDAGSETNTELAADIPGPTNNHVDPGEGYIHIHTGIRGVGDLDAAMYDWRNPVAIITVEQVGDDHDDD
jgi:hypothetical protein